MKQFYLSILCFASVLFTGLNISTFAQTASFNYTGNIQNYTVPSGITQISVSCVGAQGGPFTCITKYGGKGGHVVATVAVSPGEVIYVYCGQEAANSSCGTGSTGGYNGGTGAQAGGGNGGTGSSGCGGSGGGGSSDIRTVLCQGCTGGSLATSLSSRIVVAGGGSGAGYDEGEAGAAAGGNTGSNGVDNGCYGGYGYGGSQTAGGAAGGGGSDGQTAGGFGYGGFGGYFYGSGGGGGWFGGGGAYAGSGGGGSSFPPTGTSNSIVSAVTNTAAFNGANAASGHNGYVIIQPICGAGVITGTPSTCVGFGTQLSNVTSGGGWSTTSATASVNSSGLVTGIATGTALISYGGALSCGTAYATIVVSITGAPVITGGATSVCQSQTTTLTGTLGGTSWSSSNTSVGTAVLGSSTTGIVTGVAGGTTIITYSVSATCFTTVTVTVLSTNPVTGSTSVCQGLNTTLSDATGGGVWSSSNTAIGTVDPVLGVVYGVAAGGPISVSYTQPNGCVMTGPITVNPLPATIAGAVAVCNGLSTTLTDGSAGGTWSSGNTTIATVAGGTGVVTGATAGTTLITYTLPTTCIMTTTYLVNPLPLPISGNAVCLGLVTTLTDGTAGGTWSSSNTAIGSIGSTSGIVGGISVGGIGITYTLIATGCINSIPFTVNPLPLPITGTTTICGGVTTFLSDLSGGGVGVYSTVSPAVTIGGLGLTGAVTGVTAGSAIITYTLPTTCISTTTMTILTTPTPITGAAAALCSSHSVALGSLPGGGTWTSGNPYQATVDPALGTLTGVSAGHPVISYTLSDGCQAFVTTTINNSPSPVSGPANLCAGATGTLTDATAAGNWSTTSPGVISIGATTGALVAGVSGTATISYTLPVTGCYAALPFTTNSLPAALSVGGGGSYCIGGSGVSVNLTGASLASVNYYLYDGSSLVGSLPGNGGALSFSPVTSAGTYSVSETSTGGCNANATGHATVTINPLPVNTYTFMGGGNYCMGSNGVDLSLSGSQSGVWYVLWYDGITRVDSILGGGSGVDFNPTLVPGVYTYNAGAYTVVAENSSTQCESNIAGSLLVNINSAPGIDTVTGGGNYCPYGSGVHVGLDYSVPGITYYLSNVTGVVDSETGASSSLDFGLEVSGVYSVTATNSLTGCSSVMYNSVTVGTYMLPFAYPVTGGGPYCAGTSGSNISITPSDYGFYYQLYHLSTPIGVAVEGNGGTLSFGNQTLDSTYTVVGTDGTTGCYEDMTGSVSVSTEPVPTGYAMTGGGAYCAGGGVDIGLASSDIGIIYQIMMGGTVVDTPVIGTGSPVTFAMFAIAGTYTVVATNAATLCMSEMPGSETVSINSLPTPYNVTGGGSFCSGGTGVHVGLDHSGIGIRYTLYNGTTIIDTLSGSNASLDFGALTDTGTYSIGALNTVTGCTNMMAGSTTIAITPSPTIYTVSSTSSSYCAGGAGVGINLTGSDLGLSYQLYLNGVSLGGAVTGTGTSISLGTQTGVGMYSVIGSNLVSSCTEPMAATPVVTINPLPEAYNVTGGGNYCNGGTGVTIGLNSSTTGQTYSLYNSSGTMVSSITGTGGALMFGPQTGTGWYKVTGMNPLTSCTSNMNDSALINVNPLPSIDTLTGGGGYCAGSPGAHIGLNTSSSGISYKLYNGSTLASTVSGSTGSSLDFGLLTATGSYSVTATDMATGCTDQMNGSKSIAVNALPPVYTMFGGGGYCSGTAGVHVNLSGSTLGINYQLYYGGTAIGVPVSATGAALDFGIETAPGAYTAIATDPGTLCTSNMGGTSTVMINPLPTIYNVTGGGSYCAGTTTGAAIGVDHSDIGFSYALYLGTAATGSALSGAGIALNFGMLTTPGVYSVVSTNISTSCRSTMAGTASIAVNPVVAPSVSLSTGADVNICAGNVLTITATPTNGGLTPSYQWTVNGVIASTGNSYTYVPSNGDIISSELMSSASCAMPSTAVASTLVTVAPYETPAASIMATPGNMVCGGTPVTINATTSYGGSAPTYTWLLNSAEVGTGLSYSYMPATGDVLEFMLGSNLPCRTTDVVFSNSVLMEVDQPYTPYVTLTATPGTTIGAGTAVTLYADAGNAGPSPTYQWLVNGISQAGASNQTFSSSNFANNDSVTCIVNSTSNACGSAAATNSLIMKVGALGVSQVTNGSGSFSVVPNPSNGTFILKGTLGSATNETVTAEITDVLGQIVYTRNIAAVNGTINDQVELTNVSNGMYLLNLHTSEGVTVFHIVVEK